MPALVVFASSLGCSGSDGATPGSDSGSSSPSQGDDASPGGSTDPNAPPSTPPSTGGPGNPGKPPSGGNDAGTNPPPGKKGDAGTGGGGDSGAGGGGGGDAGPVGATDCTSPNLTWKSANKTNFTSYPAPGSPECIQFNGCAYEGQFAACTNTEPLSWVQSHNIVSVFPNLNKASNGISALALHDLCLRDPSDPTHTILVTALDECADSDCSGCCTQNQGSADELIDIESFTDARWGVQDGPIEWADLGNTTGPGCN